MSEKGTLDGTWESGSNAIKYKLPLIIFKDQNNQIFYCPALDISGYGATEENAYLSFQEVLKEYFRYTTNKGTLLKDLERLGWTLRKRLRNKVIPPTLSSLLETNKDFSRIFNNYDFKKIEAEIDLPAIA